MMRSDRSESTVGAPAGPDRLLSESPSSVIDEAADLVVVVDPVSTGACLAAELAKRGHKLVRCWSDACPPAIKAHTAEGLEVEYVATTNYDPDNLDKLAAELAKLGRVSDVLVGCETGVLAADVIAAALGVRGNGIELSSLRRNKFNQIEAVRSSRLDAPFQRLARDGSDVEAFLAAAAADFEAPFRAVVKPVDGAASDGVSICDSPAQVRSAFDALQGSTNVMGLANREVLLQEYLRGDEYVVDTVSRDGEHKVVALWRYDKRAANGAPVVYFGMELIALGQDEIAAEPRLVDMMEYACGALDAIGIRHGAMHTEVKLEARGPVLVEVNCRLHGGEGIWLPIAQSCLGYTQVTAMADAYFRPAAFRSLPSRPTQPLARGAWVTVRSGESGVVEDFAQDRLAALRALPSYAGEYLPPSLVGTRVARTVDACGTHGCFNLVHTDAEQLAADYEAAQAIVEEGILLLAPAAQAE